MDGAFFEFIEDFGLAFIPLFVAMEPLGVIPMFLAMTRALNRVERKRVLFYSLLTATAITVGFLLIGKAVFIVLGISISDFQIAGGLVLLSIAITDIVQTARGAAGVKPTAEAGVVPIGTPLIAGPAALTTIVMMSDLYGVMVTGSALIVNLFLIWLSFRSAESVVKFVGEGGARGFSKVISLLLAAIAVMMIRRGLEAFLA